jgi:hypothetical protein
MSKKQLILYIAILILGAILRIGYFGVNAYNMDIEGDEPWSKINLALRWLHAGQLVPDLNFGPLHTYLISALAFLSAAHFILLSRLVSLVFGVVFIALYFETVRVTLGTRIALWGAVLLAAYPLHIHLSSVSLPETTAYFLLFASLYYLEVFSKKERIGYLFISALSLNLAGMLRFECWFFAVLFAVLLLLRGKPLRQACLFFSLASVFPAAWLLLNYIQAGNPLAFAMTAAAVAGAQMEKISLLRRGLGFFKMLGLTLPLPVCIAALGGLALSVYKKSRSLVFLLLFIPVFLIFELRSLLGTYAYSISRYSLILGLLCIPLAAIFLDQVYRRYRKPFVWVVIIGVCATFSLGTLASFSKKIAVSDSLVALVSWIAHNTCKTDKLLLECGVYHPFIVLNAKLNADQVIEYDHLGVIQGKAGISQYLKEADYVFVCKKSGRFRDLTQETVGFGRRRKVFANDEWDGYKTEK